jgi:hypothetical protein
MGTPNLSEIVTTTIEARSGKLADNVSKNNALLDRLERKGKRKAVSGGRQIVQELEYGENGTFGWYSGYDPLNISPSEVFSAAQFDWKQASVAVSVSGLEELMNAGEEQIIDLLEARIENAERTMRNQMALAVYGDGTAAGGKAIGGLQLLVADAPNAGTVGGINRATWAFWRNVKFGSVADGGGAASTANIISYMNRIWLQLVRGADKPDLIPCDNTYYRLYMEALQPQQRFSSSDMAQAGFESLKFQSADVVFDGGIGGGCPASHMYFLNTDYIYLRPHSKRQYVPLAPDRFSTNQDAMVKLIGWAGNMTTSGAQFQGVLIA